MDDLTKDPSVMLQSYRLTVLHNDEDGQKIFAKILKDNWDVDVNNQDEIDQLEIDIDRGYFDTE